MDFADPFHNTEENIEISGWEPVLGGQLAEKAVWVNEATKNLEDALGKVTVKNKTSDAFISNQIENLTQLKNESNVTF